MLYVLHLLDKPGTADLRRRLRPEHKTFLARMADRIAFAGPLLADDGETMIGSLFLVAAPGRAHVEAFNRADPFHAAGIWQLH